MRYEDEQEAFPTRKPENLHQLAAALERVTREMELDLAECNRTIAQTRRTLADVLTVTPYTAELAEILADALEQRETLIIELDGGNWENHVPDCLWIPQLAEALRAAGQKGDAEALRELVRSSL